MDIYEREKALMRLIFKKTLMASQCEVESIVGVGKSYAISQEWKEPS